MIHLDTNFLIGSLTSPSPLQNRILAWFGSGEEFAVSAIVWSEFMNGPVTAQQIHDAQGIIQGRILPFDQLEAELSAKLYNHVGRKRSMQTDCFVAATAVRAGVQLATLNQRDFARFTPLGLRLA